MAALLVRSMRAFAVVILSLFTACVVGIQEALNDLTPTPPAAPATASDSVRALALRRAAIDEKQAIDYGLLPSKRLIIIRMAESTASPRMLPVSEDVRFLLLRWDEIHRLAERHGHFTYLIVSPAQVEGDSARVSIATAWAGSSRNPGTIYLSGGACTWQFHRRSGHWAFDKGLSCLIS
ncbi:MAG: hypothetical protein Q8Q14_01160 [Gemmatimonadales bacterium]|nr:hypothetical protein [Gemmatimonadales bacterium]